jgi:hypothetical protein
MDADALILRCCYCGRRFQPDLRPNSIMAPDPRMNEQEAREVATLMRSMMNDGLPLECGTCREVD